MFRCQVTRQIELRLLEQRHAEELFKLVDANRSHLREWMPWLDSSRSAVDTGTFIDSGLRQFAENRGFQAGVWVEGRLCGVIGHHTIDWANRSTSLGYWLDAGRQGRGIMTAACRAIVAHDLGELALQRVVIRCGAENRKSRAIPERLGFKLEGILRDAEWLYDHFVDHASYALLRTDAAMPDRV